jgi:peroxiredoxin
MRWRPNPGVLALAACLALSGCNRGDQPAVPNDVGQPLTVVPGARPHQVDATDATPADVADYAIHTTPIVGRGTERALNVRDPYLLLGQHLGPWQLSPWANSQPLSLENLRGRVVVIRFWSDNSDACSYTMPALQRLAEEFRDRPVTFIGAYVSHDSLLENDWTHAAAQARQWKLTFPLAHDRQGWTLNQWWLSRLDHLPLTPTFLLGTDGRVIYVQPGPGFFPTDDPRYKLCNEDYRALRAAIRGALKQQLADAAQK